MNTNLLNNVYFGNTVENYLEGIVIFLGLLIIFWIIQMIFLTKFEKVAKNTKSDVDNLFIKLFRSIKPPFYIFISLYIAIQYLELNDLLTQIIRGVFILYVVYQAVTIIDKLVIHIATRESNEDADKNTAKLISTIISSVFWIIGALLILSNIGVNISSLLAGLGIGGIAIALAMQNILSDLFSSFSIYFDKPFKPGDFIIVGNNKGTVKSIGIKSTRIKSIDGEEIVISNRELTTAEIHNYKKMQKRRVQINIGVVYDTDSTKLKKIPIMIQDIISHVNDVEFGRAHLKTFGDYSLGFEIIYYIPNSDYEMYMDINQEILLSIKETFDKHKIIFAYPTRTIYLQK